MSRLKENIGFVCRNCNEEVEALSNGSYRNHCPFCLYSLHVDEVPGDRSNTCVGLMEPIGIKSSSKKGMQIIHRCTSCGEIKVNRIAEDTLQPDSIDELIKIM